jgi:hypothetical protein
MPGIIPSSAKGDPMKKGNAAVRNETTATDLLNEREKMLRYLQSEEWQIPEAQRRGLEQMIKMAALQAKKMGIPLAKFQEMCGSAREAVEPLDTNFQFGMPRQTRKG